MLGGGAIYIGGSDWAAQGIIDWTIFFGVHWFHWNFCWWWNHCRPRLITVNHYYILLTSFYNINHSVTSERSRSPSTLAIDRSAITHLHMHYTNCGASGKLYESTITNHNAVINWEIIDLFFLSNWSSPRRRRSPSDVSAALRRMWLCERT